MAVTIPRYVPWRTSIYQLCSYSVSTFFFCCWTSPCVTTMSDLRNTLPTGTPPWWLRFCSVLTSPEPPPPQRVSTPRFRSVSLPSPACFVPCHSTSAFLCDADPLPPQQQTPRYPIFLHFHITPSARKLDPTPTPTPSAPSPMPQQVFASMASQTLAHRLGSVFWQAFSGLHLPPHPLHPIWR